MADMTTNDKPVWPDELMIRDTGINDDAGGKGQRIYTTAGFGYEKVKYVRADLYARPQPADNGLHRHLLDMLGVATHEEAGAEIARLHLAAMRPQPAAPHVPETQETPAMLRALLDTDTDLNRLLANIIDAEKRDPKWEGMADIVRGWIARNRAALATPPASSPQVPEGWRVMRFTGSWQASNERWEVYSPDGSGGAVNASDVADPMVRDLLDALTTPPAPEQPGSDIARRVMRADEIQRRTGCSIATAVELARAGERQAAPEQPKPAGDVEALLARYEAWIKTIPVGAEDNTRGASSYNWHMTALYQLRRLAAQPAQGEGEK